ncbi:MAG: ion channel [Spirochaetia bacterium]
MKRPTTKRQSAGEIPKKTGFWRKVRTRMRAFLLYIKRENLPQIVAAILAIILFGGGLVYFAESSVDNDMFTRFFDAVWWGVVTLTTVGYGDAYPVSVFGRSIAVVVMLTGVVVTSILSGTIASIFVDRKMREGKGLQEITLKNHTILCGWNKNSEGILESFINMRGTEKLPLVLINAMDPESFQELKTRYESLDIRFVRGDFSNEKVLRRGGIQYAKSAVIVPDTSGTYTLSNADERTILASFALKAINPDITICAELVNSENEQHLIRANVDDIIINGEFSGFLLASSTMSIGVSNLVRQMLTTRNSSGLMQQQIPGQFVGKNFLELSEYYLRNGEGILVGLLSEEKKMSLDDILSEDSSGIDDFIKRKFQEAEIDLGEQELNEANIQLCPKPDYIIKDTDVAFIIRSMQE